MANHDRAPGRNGRWILRLRAPDKKSGGFIYRGFSSVDELLAMV